ncbi:hypothetical protein C1H76_2081 [Elsinoe australis]|uniref:Uncharacterized protein n=1 Tax=Elsinoe australis TaxID=40998 RepID=A0A4U7B2I9_9PEZI|nr:hypothetical protein C1H76_2081 [Elsinoe australis]
MAPVYTMATNLRSTPQIVKLIGDVFYPGMKAHPDTEHHGGNLAYKAAARKIWGTDKGVILIDLKGRTQDRLDNTSSSYVRYVLDKFLDENIDGREITVIATQSWPSNLVSTIKAHVSHINKTRSGDDNPRSTKIEVLPIGNCHTESHIVIFDTKEVNPNEHSDIINAVAAARYGLVIIADCEKLFKDPAFPVTDLGRLLVHRKTGDNAHVVKVDPNSPPADLGDKREKVKLSYVETSIAASRTMGIGRDVDSDGFIYLR